MTRLDEIAAHTPTGMELVASWRSTQQHGARSRVCPTCGDSTNVAITKIAYVFEPCECGDPEFTHLLEVLYHRTCLVAWTCERFRPHRRGRKVGRKCTDCGRAERGHAQEANP